MADTIPLIDLPRSPSSAEPVPRTHQVRRKPLPTSAFVRASLPAAIYPSTNTSYHHIADDEYDTRKTKSPVWQSAAYDIPQPDFGRAPNSGTTQSWIPYSLRFRFLTFFYVFGICFLTLLVVLHVWSNNHTGLMTDDGSTLVLFFWRFAPTLVAVVYVFCSMILAENVNRTEGFARMNTATGSIASATLFRRNGPWWSAIADSFPRVQNEHKGSKVLFAASLAYVLGLLILSPLSGALLSSQDATITQEVSFLQPDIGSESFLAPDMSPFTYYRTLGNLLQNVTTSTWITDTHTIVPFWPKSPGATSATLPASSQTWQTKGLVLETDMSCDRLKLTSGPSFFNWTYTYVYWNNISTASPGNEELLTYKMSSASGCEFGFAMDSARGKNDPQRSSSFWAESTDADTIGPLFGQYYREENPGPNVAIYFNNSLNILFNYTDACRSKHLLTSFVLNGTTKDFSSLICEPSLTWAIVNVATANSNNRTVIQFDRDEYQRAKKPMSENMVNTTSFLTSFLGANWTNHLQQAEFVTSPTGLSYVYQGPMAVPGALNDFNTSNMIAHEDIAAVAGRLFQRAFAEAFQDKLQDVASLKSTNGKILRRERRIIVVPIIAYVYEVILGLHIVLACAAGFLGRRSKRDLGVSRDFAFVNTIASLVSQPYPLGNQAKKLSLSDRNMGTEATKTECIIRDGKIAVNTDPQSKHTPELRSDFNGQISRSNARTSNLPFVLSSWVIITFTALLGTLLIVIVLLFWYSRNHGLYQSAWVFQTDIQIGNDTLGRFVPSSIIPTLLAVIVGLWWGATESFFRKAQPYVKLVAAPTASSHGSGLSYQSSYSLWACGRAAYRKHWLLATLSMGVFATQALTIAMSALWQNETTGLLTKTDLQQPLQLRQIPHVFYEIGTYKGASVPAVLRSLFTGLKTNWMYSATIQLTLNGSEPAWSKDGWSFVPVDISNVVGSDNQAVPSAEDGPGVSRTTNATVHTSALGARMECIDWPDPWWMQEVNDVSNATVWNGTTDPARYPRGWTVNSNFAIVPGVGYPSCCPQGSMADPGVLSHGYWVPSAYSAEWVSSANNQAWSNFTVKWIQGKAQMFQPWTDSRNGSAYTPRLTWLEKPTIVAINCTPIIEWTEAEVTVDITTGNVQHFQLLAAPQPHEFAWLDHMVEYFDPRRTRYTDWASEKFNVTNSYGDVFVSALVRGSQLNTMSGTAGSWPSKSREDETDTTFNFRQPGLNIDFMTYSMLSMVNNNYTALHDSKTFTRLAQRTFSTFFQHFASSNVTIDGEGGWAFQRVNGTLPKDFPSAPDSFNGTFAPHKSSELTPAYTSATISRPVEMLQMSTLATWLSVGILAFLLITNIVVTIVKERYFSPLLRKIDTPGDIALLLADSEQYLALARQRGMDALQDQKDFATKLGWFRTKDGRVVFGIEIIHPNVDWLTEEEVQELTGQRDTPKVYEKSARGWHFWRKSKEP